MKQQNTILTSIELLYQGLTPGYWKNCNGNLCPVKIYDNEQFNNLRNPSVMKEWQERKRRAR